MGKKGKAKRERQQFFEHLVEQAGFLVSSAISYDNGNDAEAKRIATCIRTFVHDRGRTVSLMTHLDKKNKTHFLSSGQPVSDSNLAPSWRLLAITLLKEDCEVEVQYQPLCVSKWQETFEKRLPFEVWWGETIFIIPKGDEDGNDLPFPKYKQVMSRRNVVHAIADKDGGAHVDADLDEAHFDLSRANALRFTRIDDGAEISFKVNGGQKINVDKNEEGLPLNRRPDLAAVRQIGHELLLTLFSTYPQKLTEQKLIYREHLTSLYRKRNENSTE